jgi:hypothetical protein
VHLVKFFDSFLQTPDIKIVEAALPESAQRIVAADKRQTKLSSRVALLAAQTARNALLQDLNHSGRRAFCWLADEQVDVLGHDDVAYKKVSVAVARLAKNLNKRISSANRAQKREAPIASECDEMKIAASLMANEFVSHGKKEQSNPRPSNRGRVGHLPR